jgi:hypothetical protein
LISQNFLHESGDAEMIEKTLEIIELEYSWMKRFARILLLSVMAFPTFQYGPLLWKDGSYDGRWNFAANMEPQPIGCQGYPSIIQWCDLKFAERTDKIDKKVMKISYMTFGADWNNALPDVIRSSDGHYSSTIATNGPGLLARTGALLALFIVGLCIEKIALLFIWRSMVARVPVVAPPPPRSKETVMLSRDQRDRI